MPPLRPIAQRAAAALLVAGGLLAGASGSEDRSGWGVAA